MGLGQLSGTGKMPVLPKVVVAGVCLVTSVTAIAETSNVRSGYKRQIQPSDTTVRYNRQIQPSVGRIRTKGDEDHEFLQLVSELEKAPFEEVLGILKRIHKTTTYQEEIEPRAEKQFMHYMRSPFEGLSQNAGFTQLWGGFTARDGNRQTNSERSTQPYPFEMDGPTSHFGGVVDHGFILNGMNGLDKTRVQRYIIGDVAPFLKIETLTPEQGNFGYGTAKTSITDHNAVRVRLFAPNSSRRTQTAGNPQEGESIDVMTINMQFQKWTATKTVDNSYPNRPTPEEWDYLQKTLAILFCQKRNEAQEAGKRVLKGVPKVMLTKAGDSSPQVYDTDPMCPGPGESPPDVVAVQEHLDEELDIPVGGTPRPDSFRGVMALLGYELVESSGLRNNCTRHPVLKRNPDTQQFQHVLENACATATETMTLYTTPPADWVNKHKLGNALYVYKGSKWQFEKDSAEVHLISSPDLTLERDRLEALDSDQGTTSTSRIVGPICPRSLVLAKFGVKGGANAGPKAVVGTVHISGGRFEDVFSMSSTAEERTKQGERSAALMKRAATNDLAYLVGDFNGAKETNTEQSNSNWRGAQSGQPGIILDALRKFGYLPEYALPVSRHAAAGGSSRRVLEPSELRTTNQPPRTTTSYYFPQSLSQQARSAYLSNYSTSSLEAGAKQRGTGTAGSFEQDKEDAVRKHPGRM
jgi:hypothetical protein